MDSYKVQIGKVSFGGACRVQVTYFKPLLDAWAATQEAHKDILGGVALEDFLANGTKGEMGAFYLEFIKRLRTDGKRETSAAGEVERLKVANSRAAHMIRIGGLMDGVEHFLALSTEGKRVERIPGTRVAARFVVLPLGKEEITEPEAFYFACVEAAFSSLWASYRRPINVSVSTAYAVFSGHDDATKRKGRSGIGEKKMERFIDACERLRMMAVDIDAREEGKARGAKRLKGWKMAHFRLPLAVEDCVYKDDGRRVVKSYSLMDAPPFFKYADLTGQVISAEKNLFEIQDGKGRVLMATEGRTLIKYFLMMEIHDIKAGRASCNISFDRMTFLCGLDSPMERSRAKAFAVMVLNDWQRRKVFESWKYTKNGVKVFPVKQLGKK